MIVAGVMSGTSADGIDVAYVNVTGRGFHIKIKLLAHQNFPYPKTVRALVLRSMNATKTNVPDLARLNFVLGELYADAIIKTRSIHRLPAPQLIGCHGQTLYHHGAAQPFLGKKLAVTWQTGEASRIAFRVGVPVVSDFRKADMAAGGEGAPLIPFLDYLLFRHSKRGRIAQNLGGISNITVIPAAAQPSQVKAFDTGPGNMVIDALMERLFRKRYDSGGRTAARGVVMEEVLRPLLQHPFLKKRPPKTAGREEFGREFVGEFIRHSGRARRADIIATATAFTARSIVQALIEFVLPTGDFKDYIMSGGGVKNLTLMRMLRGELERLGFEVHNSDDFGVPAESKEAVAFAVMAYQTWNQQPSNLPSATGAKRPAILGNISYA